MIFVTFKGIRTNKRTLATNNTDTVKKNKNFACDLTFINMKKLQIFVALAAMMISAETFAGGLMTNTNQSASFLRSVARGTSLDPDAVYFNPAGVVFMENGFHLGISDQIAYQTRTINSTFPAFAMGANNNGATSKDYVGKAFSAVIPNLHFAWKHNRFAVMAGIGVNGGGGSLEFENGLGSFERQFAVLPGAITQFGSSMGVTANQYAMDMYLKGSSMTLAFNVGAAYRITDWLSVAAMVRFSTSSNGYEGYMKNITVNPSGAALGLSGNMMPASKFFNTVAEAFAQTNPQMAQTALTYAALTSDHILDVKQKGFSVSPVLALAFHKDNWDASVKYEFKMGTELEIKSAEASAKDAVINGIFPDGAKVKSETPALLAVAVSRQCGPVKITAEWHEFFDKDAENSFSSAVKGNTMEYLLGAEWTVSERWLVSAGVQRTQLNLNESAYSDMNFSLPSWSFGVGFAFKINDLMRLNFGYMPTVYGKVTNKTAEFTDVYTRTSNAVGFGLDFKF